MPSTTPAPARSNGQWAIDGRAPLNHHEALKAADAVGPLGVRRRVEEVYAAAGFDAIPPDDLYQRLRWWGLYPQRRQGEQGARAGGQGPEALADRFFLLRVRCDGGALTTAQLRAIGQVSAAYARDTADVTHRQNVQLHWVRIEDVPEIWRRLEASGLSTIEAGGDAARTIVGSPVAGVAADEILDPTPVIRAIADAYLGDPGLANLPRKFKTAITGHPSLDVVHEVHDLALVGVRHPRLGPGYDLWAGGGLSTAPRLAERLGAFVAPERAAEVWLAMARLFRDYGYRRLRAKARLKFLVADWGVERLRHVLEDEYLAAPLPDGPAPAPATGPGDHVGVHPQKDGRLYVGLAPTVGRVPGSALQALADAAEASGSGRVRLTPHQKIVVLDVDPGRLDALLAGAERAGLTASPSPFRRHTTACTGIEFCKLALVDTKNTARAAVEELERRLADVPLDVPISVHVNGCPYSCARIQIADIGLRGQVTRGPDGADEASFQLHLGGGLASAGRAEPGLGQVVRGVKVPAGRLAEHVERLTRAYLAGRGPGESFAAWAVRAGASELGGTP